MLSKVIEMVARSSIQEMVSAEVLYGTVLEEAPLKVFVDERFILSEESLVVPAGRRKKTVRADWEGVPGEVTVEEGIQKGDRLILLHLSDCYLAAGKL